MKANRQRLDTLLVSRGLVQSRQRALALILAGQVWVDGHYDLKAGKLVPKDAQIRVTGNDMPYVSRGGLKLEAALQAFQIDIKGRDCLDVGASTGGFTDCLLQHGARHVTAVDVGYGQLHWRLRSDPRVTVIERTNIRYLQPEALGKALDFACVDVSFISLRTVVPPVLRCVNHPRPMVCLIKPQFEVGKGLLGKGGVVRDPALRKAAVQGVTESLEELGLHQRGIIPSPILGPKGNQEYLAYFQQDSSPA
jgi:23S rRNA (cytidine1920-2'-O)/16S rRNA (cytidine1409-2'-O)-methyltransferase